MKRLLSIGLLIWVAFLFCGCDNHLIRLVNLQDRAIVQGVGIDWDGKQYIVTMQVFSPEGSGGQTMVDASKENARIITCYGQTVAEAVEKSALNQGKEFYLGHNRIVILGHKAAQRPLEGLLSYFVNSMDSRPDVSLLMTSGKAADIISANISQSILPAMSIENTVSNAERNGLTEEVFLFDVLEALAQPYRSTLIPFIEEETEGKEDEKDLRSIKIQGLGLFANEKYLGEIQGEEVTGLLFLRNKMNDAFFSLKTEDFARAAVQLYSSNTALNLDGSTLTANITCEATLLELELYDNAVFDNDALLELEKELEQKIREDCIWAFEKTVQMRADVYYIGDRIWKENSDWWEELKKTWPVGMEKLSLECQVDVDVLRTGLQRTQTY